MGLVEGVGLTDVLVGNCTGDVEITEAPGQGGDHPDPPPARPTSPPSPRAPSW